MSDLRVRLPHAGYSHIRSLHTTLTNKPLFTVFCSTLLNFRSTFLSTTYDKWPGSTEAVFLCMAIGEPLRSQIEAKLSSTVWFSGRPDLSSPRLVYPLLAPLIPVLTRTAKGLLWTKKLHWTQDYQYRARQFCAALASGAGGATLESDVGSLDKVTERDDSPRRGISVELKPFVYSAQTFLASPPTLLSALPTALMVVPLVAVSAGSPSSTRAGQT